MLVFVAIKSPQGMKANLWPITTTCLVFSDLALGLGNYFSSLQFNLLNITRLWYSQNSWDQRKVDLKGVSRGHLVHSLLQDNFKLYMDLLSVMETPQHP